MSREHGADLADELRARARETFVRDAYSFAAFAGSLLLINRVSGRLRWASPLAVIWGAGLALQFLVRVVAPAFWYPVLEERFFQRELLPQDGA